MNRDIPQIPGDVMPQDVTRQLQVEVARLVGKRGTGFVGSQPVSFQSRHIEELLLRKDYFVCEKSDGIRCLMLCILDPNGDEAVFLVTRENNFYRVPEMHFPLPGDINSCHNGTLVDGEIVVSKKPDGGKELRYLMFDCLALNGANLVHKMLDKRLGYLHKELFEPYYELRSKHPQACLNFPFKLSMKSMQPASRIPRVFATLDSLPHMTDGLIFTCCETPYLFGTDETLLKWKPSEENTVDFRLHLNIPTYIDEDLDERDPDRNYPNYDVQPQLELHVHNGGGNYSYFAELSMDSEQWESLKALNEPLDERIVECNRIDGQWRFLRFRDDKSDGNFITVLQKVLKSIEDSVTKEELIEIAPEIERRANQRRLDRKNGHIHHQPPPLQAQAQQHHHQPPQTSTQQQILAPSQSQGLGEYPPLQQTSRPTIREASSAPGYEEDSDEDEKPDSKRIRLDTAEESDADDE